MAKLRSTSNCLTVAWMASLFSIAVVGLDMPNAAGAQVGVCRPGTPCPCAADGTCRPKQDTFGRYHTRWRPWPGDPRQEEPTRGDGQAADDKQELKSFERPTPEKEGNRSPAKTNSFQPSETGAPEASAEETMPEQPAEDIFPDFDDQSNYQPFSPNDDAPPALPPSLRKFATSDQLAQPAAPQPPRAKQVGKSVATAANVSRKPAARGPQQRLLRHPSPIAAITQVAAEQRISSRTDRPVSMNLVNPAANVTKQGAQQAIYYEATDKP